MKNHKWIHGKHKDDKKIVNFPKEVNEDNLVNNNDKYIFESVTQINKNISQHRW